MTSPLIEPAYGDRSLSDVVPGIAVALGAAASSASGLTLPDAQGYVVFLVDGMGEMLLRRYAHAAPFLSSLTGAHGTAGVPSTTATSLTSLATGLTPGEHGLVGYTARIPGTDRLLNHLSWDHGVDPLEWQPHETAFSRLASAGVHVTNVNRREFDGSGLTVAGQRGARFVGANKTGERIAEVVAAAGRAPSLTYVYEGDLDWTGHRHGVASSAWLQQLATVDHMCEQLRESLPSSVRLVVVADHGMIDSPKERRIELDDDAELRAGVALLGGEARFRHLYLHPGAEADVVATWRERLGERATVLTRGEAIARGWFGPVEGRVAPRLGDVMVACHDDTAIVSTSRFPLENRLVGLHGSLTEDEMRIPILLA
ncbi:alkaline phosphatase family protein [Nocardioides daejeonensis]|uniref:alkaline phosphatase family protein n=1 Tax=Nocardioides daejeonensis TaxID=1046556 RepID=UPI000D74D585|nr:nucleotide pyrophosphatase/phosphodiesterase family protein [Nocardioides daejeonensis]